MQKSKIEWTNFSWNPIKGLCPVNCKTPDGKEYCYARRMYKRFGWNPELGMVSYNDLQKPRKLKKPSRIFLCSTMELFHPEIHPSTREIIFDVIKACPQHIFQILTKMPENIDREMPDNVWLGVTIDKFNQKSIERSWDLWDYSKRTNEYDPKIKFISYEPLLEKPNLLYIYFFDWIIIGRLTGYGKIYDPKKSWIEKIVNEAKECNVPVFLKDNLKEIWTDELIQELPE